MFYLCPSKKHNLCLHKQYPNIHEIKTKKLAQPIWYSYKNNLSKKEENNEYYIFKINMS